jgi:methionyl-tRNA formyltransferase
MSICKRITDNTIIASTLKEFFNEIRMRDESGHPPAYIDYNNFRLEFRRASLRRNHIEADVRIYVRE